MKELLADVTGRVIRYKEGLRDRAAFPPKDAVDGLSRLGGELPDEPTDPLEVVHLLDGFGSPATVATTGSRSFGFVVGRLMVGGCSQVAERALRKRPRLLPPGRGPAGGDVGYCRLLDAG